MLNASAKQLAMRMWMGELSSVEVTQFYIDQIEKHNPAINAVIAERFETALDEARQAGHMAAAVGSHLVSSSCAGG